MKKLAGVTLIVAAGAVGRCGARGDPDDCGQGRSARHAVFDRQRLLLARRPRRAASGPFRMQATALGAVPDVRRTGSASSDPGLKTSAGPSDSTVWQVGRSLHDHEPRHARARCRSRSPRRAAARPTRRPVSTRPDAVPGVGPEAQVSGTIDAHTHVTAFEFLGGDLHCGRPWHPFGIPYALPDCAPYEQGTQRHRSRASSTTAQPAHPHDTQRLADVPRVAVCRPTSPRRATTTPGSSGPGWPGCA